MSPRKTKPVPMTMVLVWRLMKRFEVPFPTGHDNAVVGVCLLGDSACAVMSVSQILENLIRREGFSPEDAREWFDFNIEGAYIGPNSPVYVDDRWARG